MQQSNFKDSWHFGVRNPRACGMSRGIAKPLQELWYLRVESVETDLLALSFPHDAHLSEFGRCYLLLGIKVRKQSVWLTAKSTEERGIFYFRQWLKVSFINITKSNRVLRRAWAEIIGIDIICSSEMFGVNLVGGALLVYSLLTANISLSDDCTRYQLIVR